MKISAMKTNHLQNPLGFEPDVPVFSWLVEDSLSPRAAHSRVEVALDADFSHLVFDSGEQQEIDFLQFSPELTLQPHQRYFWRVSVTGEYGDQVTSETAWFETAKMAEPWQGRWITAPRQETGSVVLQHTFRLADKPVARARIYLLGLGLYECSLNGYKVGDEYLSPGCHDYASWLQYQTLDATAELQSGADNQISVMLGNGWYKGRFGFKDTQAQHHYGDQHKLLLELHIDYVDGENVRIVSNEDWQSSTSPVQENSLYDGEVYDARVTPQTTACVLAEPPCARLQARINPPVRIQQQLLPVSHWRSTDGRLLVDFGENIAGWVSFSCHLPEGASLQVRYAEAIRGDELYRDNLRSAKAEYRFISAGEAAVCRPHFSWFGFRYVEISGALDGLDEHSLRANFLYSTMNQSGTINTADEILNGFVANTLRSQKGNFLDVPTDCPQRDERCGWTGDIQIFSDAACFNMDSYAFLNKYLVDLEHEQRKLNGNVPFIVPVFDMKNDAGSCGWGDAATVLPWHIWWHYGDKSILRQQYPSMRGWVDYIQRCVAEQDDCRQLWRSGFHFGDWLALDKDSDDNFMKGKTEDSFIASFYYLLSSRIVSDTARTLEYHEDAQRYRQLADMIQSDFMDEFLTASGRLAMDSQTAYTLMFAFDLVEDRHRERLRKDFLNRLKKDNFVMKTGFIGTAFILDALSKAGLNSVAWDLLLKRDFPGWLYPVTQGATTIWERRDGILQNGEFNDPAMNSFNHYAFGSVVSWLYRFMAGLQPLTPGFRTVRIAPQLDVRLPWGEVNYRSQAGEWRVEWQITERQLMNIQVTVPFGCRAELTLPCVYPGSLSAPDGLIADEHDVIHLMPGTRSFSYRLNRDFFRYYSCQNTLGVLLENPHTREILKATIPKMLGYSFISNFHPARLSDLAEAPFFPYPKAIVADLNKALGKIAIDL